MIIGNILIIVIPYCYLETRCISTMASNDLKKVVSVALPTLAAMLDDEEADVGLLTDSTDSDEWTVPPSIPRDLPKSRLYFSTIEAMDHEEFRSHFRLGRGNVLMIVTVNYAWMIWSTGLDLFVV